MRERDDSIPLHTNKVPLRRGAIRPLGPVDNERDDYEIGERNNAMNISFFGLHSHCIPSVSCAWP